MRPIFYDTETTGMKAEKDSIVELAAYDPVRDKTFHSLINPGFPIPAEVTAIHHITDEMVKDAPGFGKVLEDFLEFCSGEVVLIAHNNDAFDMPFLKSAFSRCQREFPPSWRFFDTLKWARRYRADLPRHALQFLRETHGIPANNAHRALDDVIVLHQIFSTMIDDLSIEEVLELMARKMVAKPITHMPFGKHKDKPLKDVPRDYVEWMKKNGAFDKPENEELAANFAKIGYLS